MDAEILNGRRETARAKTIKGKWLIYSLSIMTDGDENRIRSAHVYTSTLVRNLEAVCLNDRM